MPTKRNMVSVSSETDDKIEQIADKTNRTKKGTVATAVDRLWDEMDLETGDDC